jgi:hypothetical protein
VIVPVPLVLPRVIVLAAVYGVTLKSYPLKLISPLANVVAPLIATVQVPVLGSLPPMVTAVSLPCEVFAAIFTVARPLPVPLPILMICS